MKHKFATTLTLFISLLVAPAVASAEPFDAPACPAGDPLCSTAEQAAAPPSLPQSLSGSARAELARGKSIRRSLAEGTLTPDDRANLRAIGIAAPDAGVVIFNAIPKRGEAQWARLQKLARALDGFAPSGACDSIKSEGEFVGLCTGSTDGPLGKVPVRMPVASKLDGWRDGSLHFFLTNPRPMEVKPLFGWQKVVNPDHLRLEMELVPTENWYVVRTLIGVDMSDHKGSAKTISNALEKLSTWLVRDLSH